MKRVYFILAICLLFNYSLFSQSDTTKKPTLEETQQWIKEKLSSYSYNSDDGEVKNDYSIFFDDKDIIIKNTHWNVNYGYINEDTRISIVDIDYISSLEKTYNVWLTITLKYGKKPTTYFNNDKIDGDREYNFLLDKSFKENNLPERIKKAFAILIELYGGKSASIDEPF